MFLYLKLQILFSTENNQNDKEQIIVNYHTHNTLHTKKNQINLCKIIKNNEP